MAPNNDHELRKWVDEKISNGILPEALEEDKKESIEALFKHTPTSQLTIDKKGAWEKINKKISPAIRDQKKSSFYLWRVAAAITFIIVATFAITFVHDNNISEKVYTTGINNQEIKLIDGSIITLNKNSKLTVAENFNENNRNVSLVGEAFFSIQKTKNKSPFQIFTEEGKVKVLGTVFNVKTASQNENSTMVYVQSGKVSFASLDNDSNIELNNGQAGLLEANGTLKKIDNLNENLLYWKTRKLSFKSQKLIDIVNSVNSHLNGSISLAKDIENCVLTMSFTGSDPTDFVETLQRIKDIEVKKKGESSYFLNGGACL